MASTMEVAGKDGSEFSLREWSVKAQSSGEKTKSRRHSASYIRSFQEDAPSFRSHFTFSSAASSPAYSFKDGIDPTTYSFNTALRALQARSSWYNNWECVSPDGFALNSKWNEAERYICNPLSGEVPLECLSAKALTTRSFRKPINKINVTVSDDPIVSALRNSQTKISSSYVQEDDEALDHQFPIPEKKREGMTRDVGTQSSTPYCVSSSSPSPASTPSIKDTTLKRVGDSPNSNARAKYEEEAEERDKEKKEEEICRENGCFPWMKKKKLKEKGRHIKINIFIASCQRKEPEI